MEEIRLTPDGLKQLESRLEFLKNMRRREIAQELQEARSHGDLSENAEYDAAKEAQERNEIEIAELESKLRNVVIIDEASVTTDVVSVGTTVSVHNEKLSRDFEYHIVGTMESDPMKGFISDASPIGKGLLGHTVGETVEVETPGGIISLSILSIGKTEKRR